MAAKVTRGEYGETVWFVPVFSPSSCPSWVGKPTRNEAKARATVARIARAMLSGGFDRGWKIGVSRCWNRRFPTEAGAVYGEYASTEVPPLPPLPTSPNRQVAR